MNQNEAFISSTECQELAKIIDRKFAGHIGSRYFEVTATRDENGVYAKITLRNDKGDFVYPVEGRVAHASHSMSHLEAVYFLFDFISSYFDEYFSEGGEIFLPIDWADYECESIPIQVKGQIVNLHMEQMADKILASGSADQSAH
jgi:hypothetical protein